MFRLKHKHINIRLFKTTAGSITILLAAAFFSCKPNKAEEIKELTNKEELPSLILKDLTSIVSDSGRVKYRFITPEMAQYDQRSEPIVDFPNGLHLYVYNVNEEIEAQVRCNYAIYHQNEELWELRKDVEAVNTNGDVINTELMFWDTRNKKVYSDHFIKISTDSEIITGRGFESDDRLENYKILNISGILHIDEDALESGSSSGN